MKEVAQHIIRGMNRDLSDSKVGSEYAYENMNIRITAREGDTLLSVTNEKGNKKIDLYFSGIYLGKCVINDNIIIFTTSSESDFIYKIDVDAVNNTYTSTILFYGDLNFNHKNPIEAIGLVENEEVKKVYWVDGLNQPRVIRIGNNVTYTTDNTQFDFVRILQLQENISISRIDNTNGIFPSGTIQYAFSYYNKYGQESNIFYISNLHYIAYANRGADADDIVNCSFEITIDNVDRNFDYVRVYSIKRTSVNSTPECKIVTEVEITDDTLTITDANNSGEIIDPTLLFYIGGESIVANTITHKDNTLFLGNLILNTFNVSSLLKDNEADLTQDPKIYFKNRTLAGTYIDPTGKYPYKNTLKNNNLKVLKRGEYYRFGVQFQHETGKWSEPVFIADKEAYSSKVIPNLSMEDYEGNTTALQGLMAEYRLDDDARITLVNNGYKKARGVIVLPSPNDRKVVAQGILCPTVFNVEDRASNAPFAQASWFSRPFLQENVGNSEYYTISNLNPISDYINIAKGIWAEFRHGKPIPPNYIRNAEIQSIGYEPDSIYSAFNNEDSKNSYVAKNKEAFFIDQSILTFHSPDIEFDNTSFDIESQNLNMRIVGIIEMTGTTSNIDIQINSSANNLTTPGIINPNIGTINTDEHGLKSLISGFFFIDSAVGPINTEYDDAYIQAFNVYTWHRSGALNNHANVQEFIKDSVVNRSRTADLKHKIISNLKFSANTRLFNTYWSPLYGISPVTVFSSNEVSLVKIKAPLNSGLDDIIYYGNIDKVLTPNFEDSKTTYIKTNIENSAGTKTTSVLKERKYGYPIIVSNYKGTVDPKTSYSDYSYMKGYPTALHIGGGSTNVNNWTYGTEPVHMKYKSSPHAVIALNYTLDSKQVILPTLNYLNTVNTFTQRPYWSPVDPDYNPPDANPREFYYGQLSEIIENAKFYTYCYDGTDLYKNEAGGIPEAITDYTWIEDLSIYENTWWKDQHGIYYTIVKVSDKVYTFKEEDIENHYVVSQDSINTNYFISSNYPLKYGYLYLAELYRDNIDNAFGGVSGYDLENNMWIPAGEPVSLTEGLIPDPNEDTSELYVFVPYTDGDTYIQRYDCLKTYPFTEEDTNSVVEIVSFMCETRINIEGRYDRNRGNPDNITARPTNFNLINKAYTQDNNYFIYKVLNTERFGLNNFSSSITWSKEKKMAEWVDTWTNVTLASLLDLDGDKGELTALKVFNNEIIAFQKKGLSNILFNSRVQIPTSDGVPIEISNGLKVDGKRYISNTIGCQNKWSITESPNGLYFIDNYSNNIYRFNGQIDSISTRLGFSNWMKENNSIEVWNSVDFNNFRSFYDNTEGDVYFVNKDYCLCYTESIDQFISFMNYENVPAMFNVENKFLSFKNGYLWEQNEGEYNSFYDELKPYYITIRSNPEMTVDKIFTNIEFRADSWDSAGTLLNTTFDKLYAWNEYQSGETELYNTIDKPSTLKKKFRIWRANIPRDGRDRMRNTWLYLKLAKEALTTDKTVLHDILVSYYK